MPEIAQLAHDWARDPVLWEPKLSKDGRWAAWTWTGPTEAGNVWLAPTDGSAPPRRVTDEADNTHVRTFSPDGRRLLLAQSAGASEHDHLFLLALDGSAKRLVTPRQNDHYVFGGRFTRDSKAVLYAASWDDRLGKAIEGQCIYLHDLASGERRIVSASESLSQRPPELSDDDRLVLYDRHERHPSGSQIWLLDLRTGEDREILNVGDARKAHGSWIDERRILVWAETDSHDRVGILTLPSLAVRWLIDDAGRSIDDAVAGTDGGTAAIIEFRQGALRATSLDVASGKERPMEAAGYSLLPIEQLPSGAWLCERYSSRAPHELVRFDPVSGALNGISRTAEHRARRSALHAGPPPLLALYGWD